MDANVARAAGSQGGIFLRYQALDAGYTEKEIAGLLRSGSWVRLRRGAYAARETAAGLDAVARHALLVRAVAAQLSGRVVVTGYSALAVLGVPLWGVDLRLVHVHREVGKSPRREAGVVHHVGALPDDEVVEVGGLLLTIPERSTFEACRPARFDAGVVMVDGARRLNGYDVERASDLIERYRDWSGSVNASRALRFSSDRSATVGESRARILLARIGLPAPCLQHEVRDAGGNLLAITDFYIEALDTVAEFDGKLKYGRELYEASGRLEDVDLGAVVWNEKRREDAIRDRGYEVVRMVWSELDGHDAEVAGRFLRAARRSERARRAG